MVPTSKGKPPRKPNAAGHVPGDADPVLDAQGLSTAFAALVKGSPDFVALVDSEARVLFLNPVGRELAGLSAQESLAGRTLDECLPPEAARALREIELPAIAAGGRWSGEGQLRCPKTGREFDVAIDSFVVPDPTGARPLCIATVRRDISDRKRESRSLRASEERFRQLAENIDEVFWISEFDPRRIVYVSPAYERMFGNAIESLYENANAFMDNIHPDDVQRVAESLPLARSGGYDVTFRVVHPDGAVRIIRSRAFPVRNDEGVVYRVAGIAEDITETKHVEEELVADRRFLEHLLDVHEGERKLVAYDIHDGFVQSAIAAVMHLEGLIGAGKLDASTREKLGEPVTLLRNAIEEARRLIAGLRPPVIDEQGLVAAIEYLVHEKRAAATKVEFHHAVTFDRLDPVLEGALFRIVQEGLTNVFRHSQAETAQVSLQDRDGWLTLSIEDQGVGFDPQKVTGRKFGLRGIRERARLCGGTATIESKPGAGTRICVRLPLGEAIGPAGTQ